MAQRQTKLAQPAVPAARPDPAALEHLAMWNRLEVTDPKHVKPFNRGNFKGSAVDPVYNLKRVTAELGPVGHRWGWRIVKDELITIGEGDAESWIHNCILEVWFVQPDGTERVIHEYGTTIAGRMVGKPNERRFMVDDEYTKKSKTDALSRAMMALGASTDIWMGRFDGNKYVAPSLEEKAGLGAPGQALHPTDGDSEVEGPAGFMAPKTEVDLETPRILAKADMLLERLAAVGSEPELRQVQNELTGAFEGEPFWTVLVRTSKVKASDLTKAIKATAESLAVPVRPAANEEAGPAVRDGRITPPNQAGADQVGGDQVGGAQAETPATRRATAVVERKARGRRTRPEGK